MCDPAFPHVVQSNLAKDAVFKIDAVVAIFDGRQHQFACVMYRDQDLVSSRFRQEMRLCRVAFPLIGLRFPISQTDRIDRTFDGDKLF